MRTRILALTAPTSRLAWWQGMLLMWLAIHAAALALVVGLLAMSAPAKAGPPACRTVPCELRSAPASEFEWLGWYARNQHRGFEIGAYQGVSLTRASFTFKRQDGVCSGMCAVVTGMALKQGAVRIHPDAVFCYCGSLGVAANRWAIWKTTMPASWLAAMQTRRPFHWPLRPGEGI